MIFNLISCNKNSNKDITENKVENKNKNINMNKIDNVRDILEKQVMHGYGYKEDGLDMEIDYIYKEADYNAIRTTSIKILKSNNFNLLSKEDFQKKVLKLFNFNKIEVNFLIENSCPLEKILYQLDVNFTAVSNNKPLFIDSENKMLIEPLFLPELINYKNEYPNIYKNEEKIALTKEINGFSVKLIKWKDLPDLDQQRKKNIQTLVARNMYLFNDSKAHFKWLILNDQYFMRSLVTTFGYYDDTALVEWVAENTKMDAQDLEPLNEIIYNKKCDEKIGFNYTFLKIISEDEEKATETFNFLKWYYFDWLLNPKNTLELTFSQKAEIIARMHSFIYSNMNDYRTYEFMGTFAENYDYDNTYSKEFKAKNYYNIPAFEKQWKEAKQEGDGVQLPGEE